MDAAARADGVDLVVVSGFRSDAEQAVLFARHPDPKWVAPPGRSRHRDATELDLNMTGGGAAHAWLAANGGRFGFVQRYSWEPWHWGYVPGCGAGAAAAAAAARRRRRRRCPAWVPARVPGAVAVGGLGERALPPALLAALLRAESGFDPRAVSPAGAQGIAQFMPATAAGMGLRDPFDPGPGDPGGGAAAGRATCAPSARCRWRWPPTTPAPGRCSGTAAVPPYPETQAYVARILALAGRSGRPRRRGAPRRSRGWCAVERPLRLIARHEVCWHTMKRTTIKLPDELDARLRLEAERRGMTHLRAHRGRPSPPTSVAGRCDACAATGAGRGRRISRSGYDRPLPAARMGSGRTPGRRHEVRSSPTSTPRERRLALHARRGPVS